MASHHDAPVNGAQAAGDGAPDSSYGDEPNPYASSNRWRHAESTAFARFEKDRADAAVAREADARDTAVSDLADFLNRSRVEPRDPDAARPRPASPRFRPVVAGASEAAAAAAASTPAPPPDGREIVCGPLLNYRRMEGVRWIGSVLVVTAGGGRTQPFVPTLTLRRARDEVRDEVRDVRAVCLYSDPRNTFWRFNLEIDMEPAEARWEYALPGLRFASATKPHVNAFFVPARDESMRIMSHSCNGFSVGTDEDAWSGPALWHDVLRRHRERPFHVMCDIAVPSELPFRVFR